MIETAVCGDAQAAKLMDKAPGAVAGGFRQVWLAGLGLVAVAAEGIADGFHALVQKGEVVVPPSRQRIKEAGQKVSDKVGELVEPATGKLHAAWTGLSGAVHSYSSKGEELMDDKIAAALQRLGVPTKEEFTSLRDRLDKIAAAIAEIKEQPEEAEATRDQAARAPKRQKARG